MMKLDIAAVAERNLQRRLSPPAWTLWFLACFGTWQMGIVFYGSTALSVYGRVPLPVNVGNLSYLLIGGYAAAILLALAFQRRAAAIGRGLLIAAFLASAGLFLPLPLWLLAHLYYAEVLLCVAMIGQMLTVVITMLQPGGALRYCLYNAVICGVLVSLLQNELRRIPFWVFNAVTLVILALLLTAFFRLPRDSGVAFASRQSVKGPPHRMRGGIYLFIVISCLMTLFGSGLAEGVKNGVTIYYISGGVAGLVFIYFWRYVGKNAMRLATAFLSVAGLGFLLFIAAASLPFLRLPACILTGCGLVAGNLCEFYACALFERSPSRFTVPLVLVIALATVGLHTALLSALRESPTLLRAVCGVIAVAGLGLYLWLEPKLAYAWMRREAEAEKPAPPEPGRPPEKEPEEQYPAAFEPLSPRERILADLILRGYTMKEISAQMGIELSTQRTYRKNVYLKLDVHSRSELFELASGKTPEN